MANERLDEDGGTERQCAKCGEWWPADLEFFYANGKGKLDNYCKNCRIEYKKEHRYGSYGKK